MKTLSCAFLGGLAEFPGPWFSPRSSSPFSLFLLLTSVFCWSSGPGSYAWGAATAGGPAAFTAAVTGREADLNGARMAPGATLFPGDEVRLGASSTAALRFGSTLVLAAPQTDLVVESQGVSLRSGRLQVRASGERTFDISAPFFRLSLAAAGVASGSAEIRIEGEHALVSAVSGVSDLTPAGSDISYRLHAGEAASLDAAGGLAAAQNAANPAAGKVARLLPQVQIDRASQTLVAAESDRVFWNDNLRSGPTGRAHITLDDGSLLYLGSNSTLRILQHDAQSQQTALELIIGRLRGKVTKLTQPGAKFEIRTPVGTAGIVGTDFSLLVTNDYVELMVIEGIVRFTALNGQSIAVTAGMILRISRVGVLGAPKSATREETQTAENDTDISGTQAQNTSNRNRNNSLIPIIFSVGTGSAVIGVGAYLDTRERPPVSPITPRIQTP